MLPSCGRPREWWAERSRVHRSGTPSPLAAPRRRAARRGAPHPCQRGTCGGQSLDDLVRPPQQRRRDRQAEALRDLEIDGQVELRGVLDGEVGWLGALEDLVNNAGGTAEHIVTTLRVGHEAARLRVKPPLPNGGQLALQSDGTGLLCLELNETRIVEYQASSPTPKLGKRARPLTNRDRLPLHVHRLRLGTQRFCRPARTTIRIVEVNHPGHRGNGFLEHL